MRNFLDSVKLSDLVKSVNAGRKTTMEAEDLTFYYCCKGQVIEELCELFPNVGISIFSKTFIVESVPI